MKLKKKKLQNLSLDSKVLPGELTPNIAGGTTNCAGTEPGTGLVPPPTSPRYCATMAGTCDSCGCISDPRDRACTTNTCF